MAPLPSPESTLTTAWCATVLTWTQILATAGLVMTVCTVLCTKPVTPLAICGLNVLSSELILVSPLSSSWAEAWLIVPVRLSWLTTSAVILSVRTFWIAESTLTPPPGKDPESPTVDLLHPAHVAAAGPPGEPLVEGIQAWVGVGQVMFHAVEDPQLTSAQAHDDMLPSGA